MLTGMGRSWLAATAAAGLLFMVGCGPKPKVTGKLHGTVMFDGKVVNQAKIQIQSPKSGEAFAAKVGQDGSYQFDQPVTVGEYQASIVPEYETPVAGAGGTKELPPKPPERNDIPEKFRDRNQSGLKIEVKTGDNKFDVDMKK